MVDEDKKQWQDLAEKLADPFVSPFDKPAIAAELAAMSTDIVQSVQDVASGKVAPEDELLGPQGKKQLRGARAVARQLREDILPSASTEGQKLVESLQQGRGAAGSGPGSLSEAGERLQKQILQQLDDITATGTFAGPRTNLKLPSADELLTEVRNALQGSDEGLETPAYKVVSAFGEWEIREYDAMLTSTVAMQAGASGSRLEQGGNAFNTLASFLFGENTAGEAMAMTTPVITAVREDGDSTAMSFVLPSKYGMETAPRPKTSDISLEEVPPATVAAIEFPGFATKEEVVRQREALLSGLQEKGWVRAEGAPLDVTVLQYNAPYTLPTVRRNEVLIKLGEGWTAPAAEAEESMGVAAEEEKDTKEPQWEEEVKAEAKEEVKEEVKEEKEEPEKEVVEVKAEEEEKVVDSEEKVEEVVEVEAEPEEVVEETEMKMEVVKEEKEQSMDAEGLGSGGEASATASAEGEGEEKPEKPEGGKKKKKGGKKKD